ncbi:ATP-binding protein [Kiloniella antarctica]|uniref:histidine kinase n=1 Tax=Kiloniella antarctica TaxID=1550907 RepID=A0ABW5BP30_9PROT
MKFYSLKNRFHIYTLTITAISWILILAVVMFGMRNLLLSLTEDALESRSELLASALPLSYFEEGNPALEKWLETIRQSPPEFVDTGLDSDSSYQVWYKGKVIASSYISPIMPVPTKEGISLFTDKEQDDVIVWQTYAKKIKGVDAWAVATEDMEFAFDGSLTFIVLAFFFIGENFPLIYLVLPLSFISLFWGINRSLKPLVKISDQFSERAKSNLLPFSVKAVPSEIWPIVESFNYNLEIIHRNQSELELSLESEKRFTANAAHELLTPLAAIKTEAQLRERQTTDPEQKEGLIAISLRVDRATHTVEQLVTLARLDPNTLHEKTKEVDLHKIIQNVSADLGDKIKDKSIDFDINALNINQIHGLPSALTFLCRNLVDNAVRYCQKKGIVRITISQSHTNLTLSVKNTGRPLPDYMKDYIFERFVRGAGEQETGSGLGMSIVKRVADIHKAEIILSDPEDLVGLQVDVIFPIKEKSQE